MFRKKKVKTVEQYITHDYQMGMNYQQLAEKYDKSVEQIAEIIGA